jgi:hypothetical protein
VKVKALLGSKLVDFGKMVVILLNQEILYFSIGKIAMMEKQIM